MNMVNLGKVLENEPKYRIKQAHEAVFVNLLKTWTEATNFPLYLREQLEKECSLNIKAETLISKKENNVKVRIALEDGVKIESILMRHNDGRNTVCVSSQAGCPLGCEFCATGKMGFKRNLNTFEIIEQVIFFSRLLKKEKKRVSNVVFMGMGEPFLNYENVIEAVRILNDKNGLNIGVRKISISTVGLIDGIKKLSEEKLQINLAISLHAPNNELRSRIIPSNLKYNIDEILKMVDEYILKTKRQVMFEYLLIQNVNDSDECAKELASLMKKPLYFLNLIPYNPTGDFKPPSTKRLEMFKEILKREEIVFSQRYRFGEDIRGACGQFVS